MDEIKWFALCLVSILLFLGLLAFTAESADTKQLEACAKAGMEYRSGECVQP